jgi:hypothetical protein
VGGIIRQAGTFALGTHDELRRRLHLHFDVPVEGDSEGVEAGPQVG